MARTVQTITTSWVNVFTGPGTITVDVAGKGNLLINDAASDTGAMVVKDTDGPRAQVIQYAAVATYMRATTTGWKVIYDANT